MAETGTGRDRRRARTVVLCGDSAGARYMLRTIEPLVNLATVVWETPGKLARLRQVTRRSRRLGPLYPLDRIALALYSRFWLRLWARRCEEWCEVRSAGSYSPACRQVVVRSVNDDRVVQVLHDVRPHLVVVWGTSVIRKAVLQQAPRFVNVHAGITPMYRGAHGAVWAVIRRDVRNIGVTVHRVDEGIDTGEILRQARIDYDPRSDTILTLQAKQSVAGAHALAEWIVKCANQPSAQPPVREPESQSRLYFSPGLRDYMRFERVARELRRRR